MELTEPAREFLAKAGYDPTFGARPLRRVLQKLVESPLSVSLLGGEYKEGEKVLVDLDVEKQELLFKKNGVVQIKKPTHPPSEPKEPKESKAKE